MSFALPNFSSPKLDERTDSIRLPFYFFLLVGSKSESESNMKFIDYELTVASLDISSDCLVNDANRDD